MKNGSLFNLLIFVVVPFLGQAQNNPTDKVVFPVLLQPGDQFTVQPQYNGTRIDSLWLLKNNQLLHLINNSMKQRIDSARAAKLLQMLDLLQQKTLQLDSLTALQKSGYDHYRVLWEKTDRQLEQSEIRSARNLKLGFLAGVGLSTAIVIFLRK